MKYFTKHYDGACASVALFDVNRAEAHAFVRATRPGRSFSDQMRSVISAGRALSEELGLEPVFRRYFLSDATNQAAGLAEAPDCAVSVIQQPPLDGTKIGVLTIFQAGGHFENRGGGVWVGARGQMWVGDDDSVAPASPQRMTTDYLDRLAHDLSAVGASLKDNCVRTWFFVRDVDNNYSGVVSGRNEVFSRHGLTADTHFIASTGISGQSADPSRLVAFNAFADSTLVPGQMTYLYGKTHLNPTYEYGVAFERGTRVDYGDRRHVYISGTASIDNRGDIVAPGDIAAQTRRMLENIEVLLVEGGCGWEDVAHSIVYLRDIADYAVVDGIFSDRLPLVPRIIVLAPVCRPGWLVETECLAIKQHSASEYAAF